MQPIKIIIIDRSKKVSKREQIHEKMFRAKQIPNPTVRDDKKHPIHVQEDKLINLRHGGG